MEKRLDFKKLKLEQLEFAKKIRIKDDFESADTIGGIDITNSEEFIIASVVVCDENMKVLEQSYAVQPAEMPYLHEFIGYRECPVLMEAYSELTNKPDILLVDGDGILHPRKFGVASQFGLLADQATIGVSKKLSLGDIKEDSIYLDDKIVGKLIKTKEFAKEIYISPGHKVSMKSSAKIVRRTLGRHKLPEPLHLAHKLGNKVKKEKKFKKE